MRTNKVKETGIPRHILITAWAIALGAIAPMLDSTMVNIAVSQLTKDFHTTLSTIQWAITGYILALAIAVPVSGWLMNQFNSKKVFIGAVIAFGVISLLIGVSWDISSFIFFRLLQGFSAGVITTLMFTLLVKTTGQEYLGRVMAIVSTPMIFGPIFGPILGGFIVQVASWPWIFFINVFVVLISAPLMIRKIPNYEPFNKESKLDLFGIIVLSTMSIALIYGITKATDYATFNNQETILWMGIGLASALLYLVYNRIKMNQTVLPLNLFTHKNFAASSAGLFFANIAIMGPLLILPLFFQTFRHFTAIETAVALIPQGVGMLITRPFIGKMIDSIGAKNVLIVSLFLSLIGSIPFIFITDHTSMIWISVILFIRGASVGGISLPLMSEAYNGLGNKQLPEAGVGINIIENLGSSFGSAIIATAVATAIQGLHPSIANQLQAYHIGFLIAAIILALIFIPGLFLTNKKKVHSL
ncbi:DHA2 family efflux MFS transporter permease subunit [Paenibacillus polysaccharolyticus]|uniref:DHA2 family efflux MFS transporter permease subunit n=1 Tax=Paenibacillus polysaccharolyticus TaxID=582692 RepID=UPI00203B1F32|nr:DHA2 family efflux MFS transporter permease subunit [Paenibacillus polysaccharolyticus]MCM3135245.1 DHA2 family efflux MFS transporter permease subunit [Paenibacillus polysaccharolyticus]